MITALCLGGSACAGYGISDPGGTPPTGAPGVARSLAVDRPLDVARSAARPCDLLSSEELGRLRLAEPGRERISVGARECRWSAADLRDLSVVVDADRNLLGFANAQPWQGVSVPTEVAGYPAVMRKTGPGDLNMCTVITGVGPNQAVTADWIGKGAPGPGNDACEFARQATAMVVEKLPLAT